MTEFATHVEDFCTRLFEDIRKLTADTCGVTREGYTPEEKTRCTRDSPRPRARSVLKSMRTLRSTSG